MASAGTRNREILALSGSIHTCMVASTMSTCTHVDIPVVYREGHGSYSIEQIYTDT